jgi:hypothetical protein
LTERERGREIERAIGEQTERVGVNGSLVKMDR